PGSPRRCADADEHGQSTVAHQPLTATKRRGDPRRFFLPRNEKTPCFHGHSVFSHRLKESEPCPGYRCERDERANDCDSSDNSAQTPLVLDHRIVAAGQRQESTEDGDQAYRHRDHHLRRPLSTSRSPASKTSPTGTGMSEDSPGRITDLTTSAGTCGHTQM